MLKRDLYDERVKALRAEGYTRSTAIKTVAREFGITPGGVAGSLSIVQRERTAGSAPLYQRPEDLVNQARKLLERAIEKLDEDIAQAELSVEKAKARLKQTRQEKQRQTRTLERHIKELEKMQHRHPLHPLNRSQNASPESPPSSDDGS